MDTKNEYGQVMARIRYFMSILSKCPLPRVDSSQNLPIVVVVVQLNAERRTKNFNENSFQSIVQQFSLHIPFVIVVKLVGLCFVVVQNLEYRFDTVESVDELDPIPPPSNNKRNAVFHSSRCLLHRILLLTIEVAAKTCSVNS